MCAWEWERKRERERKGERTLVVWVWSLQVVTPRLSHIFVVVRLSKGHHWSISVWSILLWGDTHLYVIEGLWVIQCHVQPYRESVNVDDVVIREAGKEVISSPIPSPSSTCAMCMCVCVQEKDGDENIMSKKKFKRRASDQRELGKRKKSENSHTRKESKWKWKKGAKQTSQVNSGRRTYSPRSEAANGHTHAGSRIGFLEGVHDW